MENGNLNEVFLSFQGEGIYIGILQLFLRFSGCSLRCSFCDTPYARFPSSEFKVYFQSDKSITFKNPVDVVSLKKIIKRYKKGYHSISITGGEPLLQVNFLEKFLKEKEDKIYLETNGINYREFTKVIDFIDIISMDIKLPSSLSGKDYFKHHQRFLKIASNKNVFVKIVLTEKTTQDEIKYATKIICNISPSIPLVFQPSSREKIDMKNVVLYVKIAQNKLHNVRFIPQMHKYLKIK